MQIYTLFLYYLLVFIYLFVFFICANLRHRGDVVRGSYSEGIG